MRTFNLRQEALSRPLICAHRGVSGGNIPCNTADAFEVALQQGADMIELDVSASRDGKLYVFHPGMEPAHLCSQRYLCDMTAEEIDGLRFVNGDNVATTCPILPLDDVLEQLKGRCYINIDKYWDNIIHVTQAIRRHDMAEQILVKTSPDEAVFACMEQVAPDINYMLIISRQDEVSWRMPQRRLNYVGAEVLFERESDPVASPEYIRWMHDQGWLVWVNSIVYNHKAVLSAGHNDDRAVVGHQDEAWGWLLDRKFDIIQTDWPLMLRSYMHQRSDGR